MNHNDLIKEQFDKQSATFGTMTGHYEALDLIISLSRATGKDTVLDVACGPGIVACAFAKKVAHVHGIDLVPAMIERAKESQASQGLTNMSWDIGNVNPLPYPHCNYSIVVSRFAFHHFTDPLSILNEMTRVVKWEGKVVVVDVYTTSKVQADLYDHMEKLRDPSHTHALTLSELQTMFKEAGLNLVEQHKYRMEVDVEELLKATLTPSKEAEEFKEIVKADIGINKLGINALMKDDRLKFSFPIVIMVGIKQTPEKHHDQLSLFDIYGDWSNLDANISLVERIKKAWKKPFSQLTNQEMAALLRQRFAVEYILPLARQRIIEEYDDGVDGRDGELEEMVEQIDLEDKL